MNKCLVNCCFCARLKVHSACQYNLLSVKMCHICGFNRAKGMFRPEQRAEWGCENWEVDSEHGTSVG